MAVWRAGAAGRRRRVQVFSTVDNDVQINRDVILVGLPRGGLIRRFFIRLDRPQHALPPLAGDQVSHQISCFPNQAGQRDLAFAPWVNS
jgi:hypothetical protein